MQIVLAHPVIDKPANAVIIAQSAPANPNKLNEIPIPEINRIGFIDRLVIPSKAKANIFLRG